MMVCWYNAVGGCIASVTDLFPDGLLTNVRVMIPSFLVCCCVTCETVTHLVLGWFPCESVVLLVSSSDWL
jgi:hypothetical protein